MIELLAIGLLGACAVRGAKDISDARKSRQTDRECLELRRRASVMLGEDPDEYERRSRRRR